MAQIYYGEERTVGTDTYLHAAKGKFTFTPDTGNDDVIVTGEELLNLLYGPGVATNRILRLDANGVIKPMKGSCLVYDTAEDHASDSATNYVDGNETLTVTGTDSQKSVVIQAITGSILIEEYNEGTNGEKEDYNSIKLQAKDCAMPLIIEQTGTDATNVIDITALGSSFAAYRLEA